MNALDFFQEQYQQNNKKNDWLSDIRQRAWEYFLQQGIPTLRQESWKYTNVQPLFKQPLTVLHRLKEIDWDSVIEKHQIENFKSYRIVILDGQFYAAQSNLPVDSQDVFFTPLSAVNNTLSSQDNNEIKDRVEKILRSSESLNQSHPFAALNIALEQEGFFLWIKPNVVIDKPIEILHINSGLQENAFLQTQQIILIDNNSSAEIVERFVSHDIAHYVLNSRCDILLEENAKLTHCRVEDESEKAAHLGFFSITQQKSSHLDSFSVDLGGQLIRTDLVTRLLAPEASCQLNGLYVTNGRQHIDNHTLIEHVSSYGTSRQFYKGIVTDSSRAVFNGKVIVQKGAQFTNAAQQNKNLLLSKTAEVDTKPELEIYTDEVKCAHGSTVGQLDEEAVFYLRSRGISDSQARSLLTFAFAEDILNKLANKDVAAHVKRLVLAKLPEGNKIQECFL